MTASLASSPLGAAMLFMYAAAVSAVLLASAAAVAEGLRRRNAAAEEAVGNGDGGAAEETAPLADGKKASGDSGAAAKADKPKGRSALSKKIEALLPWWGWIIVWLIMMSGIAIAPKYILEYMKASVPPCTPPTATEQLTYYGDLGGFTHPIVTANPDAQRLFNLGILQAWNFNQIEAERAFRQAAELDPSAAAAQWGISYATGPGANRAMVDEPLEYPHFSPADMPVPRAAAERALELAKAAIAADPKSEVAQKDLALAEAAVARFAAGSELQPARDEAEGRYSALLEAAGRRFQDADLLAMAGEAITNIHTWNYYHQPDGNLKPAAGKAEALLREALALNPRQSLALHMLIHIAEAADPDKAANTTAGRAEPVAETLAFQDGPWKFDMGHLLHMPSHAFVRLGRWHDAVVANARAYVADRRDGAHCRAPYDPEHNTDMLIYAANMGGEFKLAQKYAAEIREYPTLISQPWYDPADPTKPYHHLLLTWVFQAEWEQILRSKPPPPNARGMCPGPNAAAYIMTVHRYAKAMAAAARVAVFREAADKLEGPFSPLKSAQKTFKQNLDDLKEAAAQVVEETPTVPGEGVGIYACDHRRLATIYELTARARAAHLDGNLDAAEALLSEAVAVEGTMGYMEPPRLFQPGRHCLGLVQLQAEKPAEAEASFAAVKPNNPWAMAGRVEALQLLGRHSEAAELRSRPLREAWRHADSNGTLPESPCLSFSKIM